MQQLAEKANRNTKISRFPAIEWNGLRRVLRWQRQAGGILLPLLRSE